MIEYRNPQGAMLRSLVLPGWGQFYNDKPVKGLLYGTLELGLLGLVFYENSKAEHAREMYAETGLASWQNNYDTHSSLRRTFIWYTAGAWVVGLLDAYVDAYLFSFEAENAVFDGDVGFTLGAVINF
ncbi:MAG: hypothetical protein KAR40_12815 [Candidatus Sabulitectum sp.]|nr:hypothetical protein [Candidatus Sabulitectum sp.]